jgi:hypothetical protein
MQIQSGTAAVTLGSAIVVASAGNDWSQAQPNGLFTVPGPGAVWYTIAAVRPPGVNVSGRWEITLAIPWQGTTQAAAGYGIHIDFTPNGVPLLARGDVEVFLLINRAIQALASGYAPLTPAVVITTTALESVLGSDPMTDLEAQETGALPLRTLFDVAGSLTPSRWMLISGDQETDLDAGYLRPSDFAAMSNERVFQRVDKHPW